MNGLLLSLQNPPIPRLLLAPVDTPVPHLLNHLIFPKPSQSSPCHLTLMTVMVIPLPLIHAPVMIPRLHLVNLDQLRARLMLTSTTNTSTPLRVNCVVSNYLTYLVLFQAYRLHDVHRKSYVLFIVFVHTVSKSKFQQLPHMLPFDGLRSSYRTIYHREVMSMVAQ